MSQKPKVTTRILREGELLTARIPASELEHTISEENQRILTAILVRQLRESGHLPNPPSA